MQLIRVLPPLIAEKIAAGEIIERPASVVKELIENSIDAGATEIEVHLGEGGKSSMEIIDNGFGMGPEDLALSVERHATSKLSTLEDLESIQTLGFRGEALASVNAVSELSIISRCKSASEPPPAYEYRAKSVNPVTFGHFLGSPHGTRVQVRGLFSEVPARLKFLKSQGAEVSQIREWVERLALSHPKISFRVLSEDRTVLKLRGQSEVERVTEILAEGQDYPIIAATLDEPHLKIWVHWVQGLSLPQTKRLVQIVNGRALRDRLLQQAILQPFRQVLLPGQFPAVLIRIEVDPSTLDVNVHPTKSEIRFLESGKIFRAITQTIEGMISNKGAPAFTPQQKYTNTSSHSHGVATTWAAAELSFEPQQRSFEIHPQTLPSTPPGFEADVDEPVRNPFAGGKMIGTIFNTYVAYDLGHELGLMDQHAAHERIRFEKLRKGFLDSTSSQSASQALLVPETVSVPQESFAALENRLPLLSQMGFEVEIFGADCILVRAIPANWGSGDLNTRLRNLVERLLSLDEVAPSSTDLKMDERSFERLASEACHSSVRAGDRLEPVQAQALLDQLFACAHPWNCPHGRPTIVKVPRARFEEWFQRKI